jgi:hypothetical protein
LQEKNEYNNQDIIPSTATPQDINKISESASASKSENKFEKQNENHTHIPNNNITTSQSDHYVTFSNPIIFEKIFENFNKKAEIKEKKSCVITGQPAKYYDPLTKQYYSNIESFKILRERYFQKEEDSLLFRIQTLSDFASQKKEKIKKLILSNDNGSSEASKNLLNIVNRIGILRNDSEYFDKKVISRN